MSLGRIKLHIPTRQFAVEAGEEPHTLRDLDLYPKPLTHPVPKTHSKLVDAVLVLAALPVDEKFVTHAATQRWLTELAATDLRGNFWLPVDNGPTVNRILDTWDAIGQRYGHQPLPLDYIEAMLALHATEDKTALLRYLEGLASGLG